MKAVQPTIDMSAVNEAMQMFAREAGHRAREIQGTLGKPQLKDGELYMAANIVTDADVVVGRFAEDFFTRMFPGSVVIQEETADKVRTDLITDDTLVFVVDPVDGTLFYAAGSFGWTVSVGAFRNWQPLAGCIFAPAMGDMYYTAGDRSYWNERVIYSYVDPQGLKGSILLKHMRDYYSVRAFPGYTLSYGSIALHLALTASGLACACVTSKHKVHDVAGAAKILANAGAELRYLSGAMPDWRALITNPTERAPDYFFACPQGSFDHLARYVTAD